MTFFSSGGSFSFSVEVCEFFSWSWAEFVFHFVLMPQAPDGFTVCLVLIITLLYVNIDGDVGWYIHTKIEFQFSFYERNALCQLSFKYFVESAFNICVIIWYDLSS